jgi:hypothetical protein
MVPPVATMMTFGFPAGFVCDFAVCAQAAPTAITAMTLNALIQRSVLI